VVQLSDTSRLPSALLQIPELGRVLINPILHTAAADVRFAPKATELLRRHEMT
jgi:hypothetical protein